MAEDNFRKNRAILIAGLTASGKSALALELAERINARAAGKSADGAGKESAGAGKAANQGAVIVNADSMQVYDGLRILTARPSEADMRRAPHCLYGFVDAARRFSVGAWLEAVAELLRRPEIQGKTLIFTGGTGLYFRALLGGLAEIPPISAAVRAQGQKLLAAGGQAALRADLQQHDAASAAKIPPQDSQRLLRAWEVWQETGKPLSLWQKRAAPPLIDAAKAQKFVLLPPRAVIYARINQRLEQMLQEGVLDEVAALRARKLSPNLPLMKASGLREFCAFLDGAMELPAAVEKAKQETRRYAKRQRTWFTHQLGADWERLESAEAFWQNHS